MNMFTDVSFEFGNWLSTTIITCVLLGVGLNAYSLERRIKCERGERYVSHFVEHYTSMVGLFLLVLAVGLYCFGLFYGA